MHLYKLNSISFLGFAIVMYGFLSSPTPDSIGISELLVGTLLVLSVNYRYFINHLRKNFNIRQWLDVIHFWSFLIILIVGLTVSTVLNSNMSDVVRDVVPLIYMYILLFHRSLFVSNRITKFLIHCIVLSGLLFSTRFFFIEDFDIYKLGKTVIFGDLNYFSMDPFVNFSALYLLGIGFSYFYSGKYIYSFALFVLSLFVFSSILAIVARGPILLYVMSIIYFSVFISRSKFKFLIIKAFVFLIFLVAVTFLIYQYGFVVIEKFNRVGLNSKDTEVLEIINVLNSGMFSSLFGFGWGGSFSSTAADGLVRYSHNFLAYLWLKLGYFLGTFIYSLFLYTLINGFYICAKKPFLKNDSDVMLRVVHISALISLIPPFFLQGSYKSLSFGVLYFVVYGINNHLRYR